jgi:predicted dehydrogenase
LFPTQGLDDNAHLRMTFDNGVQGTMIVSQTAPGNECGLRIRIYGDEAGLEWRQEEPNYLRFSLQGQSVRTLARGDAELGTAAQRMSRVPRGHPEGYLEAFANLYSEAAVAIEARLLGLVIPVPVECASVEDGAIGVGFIEAAIKSSQTGGSWIDPRVRVP